MNGVHVSHTKKLFDFRDHLSWSLIGLLAVNLAFFAVCYVLIRQYYQVAMPYYDSVGAYWNMFAIMNTTEEQGMVAGVGQALEYSLSWLQSFFAVLTASILPREPEALVTLNFFCLLFSQFAIHNCARQMGFSQTKSFVVALFPLLPGALMSWDGGYIDMRRDASMFGLLVASYFLAWRYAWRPQPHIGWLLGVTLGLAQWSRGNALPYIIIVLGSVVIVWIKSGVQNLGWRKSFFRWLLPLGVFAVIIAPFYFYVGEAILYKYIYGSWGLNTDRLESLQQHLSVPLRLMLGPIHEDWEATALLGLFVSLFTALYVGGLVRLNRISFLDQKSRQLAASGVLIVGLVLFLNCVVLGIHNPHLTMWYRVIPFYPLVVGLFGIGMWAVSGIHFGHGLEIGSRWRGITVILLCVGILLLDTFRIARSMPLASAQELERARQVATDLVGVLGGKPVAYLWLEHIHVHDLNFYMTQLGGDPINAGSVLAQGVDTEMPPDPNKSVVLQQEEFSHAIRTRDFVIVSEDLSAYDNPSGFFFLFRYGRPVIASLLQDPQMKRIYTFESGGRSFVVLRNSGKFTEEIRWKERVTKGIWALFY